jgi:hypothetical protein
MIGLGICELQYLLGQAGYVCLIMPFDIDGKVSGGCRSRYQVVSGGCHIEFEPDEVVVCYAEWRECSSNRERRNGDFVEFRHEGDLIGGVLACGCCDIMLPCCQRSESVGGTTPPVTLYLRATTIAVYRYVQPIRIRSCGIHNHMDETVRQILGESE